MTFYNINIITRDDPRNMILKYKKHEIKFMEDYFGSRQIRINTVNGYKYIDDINFIVAWTNFYEDNKIFCIDISVYCSLKKNILKEIDVINIETDSIIKKLRPQLKKLRPLLNK